MIQPISYRPKITRADYTRGVISRYFTQYVSNRTVVEIDENQYNFFKDNPYYITVKLPWVLVGNLYTTPSVLSVEEQNRRIVQYYSRILPTLPRYVKDFLEYVQPTINTRPAPTPTEVTGVIGAPTTTTTTTTTAPPTTTTTTTTTTAVPFEGNNGSWDAWGESSGGYSETYTLVTIN